VTNAMHNGQWEIKITMNNGVSGSVNKTAEVTNQTFNNIRYA
jgi:hypothetical protein